MQSLPVYIAFKYFKSKRKSGALQASHIITYISLAGYIVGAAALVIVLSVFNGFELLFSGMFTNFDADLKVSPKNGKYFNLQSIPESTFKNLADVASFSYVIEENALLHYSDKQTIATIKAVDENYLNTIAIEDNIIDGIALLQEGDTNYAVIGRYLAYQLSIDPGDQFNILGIYVPKPGKIDLLNPEQAFARGFIMPAGTFSIQDEIDGKYVLVPLRFFNKLMEKNGQATAIEIKLKNTNNQDKVANELTKLLGNNFNILNRYQQHESFYKVMKSEKAISFIILVFILIVAAFNTLGSLYMLVMEKKRDLFILKSMGITPNTAFNIFLLQGILVALVGGFIGISVGALVCWVQQVFEPIVLHTNASYQIQAYPVKLLYSDLLYVAITIAILGIITAIYPAVKAKKLVAEV